MRIERCYAYELCKKLVEKEQVVCFGISQKIYSFCKKHGDEWLRYVDFFVDNCTNIGKQVNFCGIDFSVYSPDCIKTLKNCTIIISTKAQSGMEILEQIEAMNIDDSVNCISLWRIDLEEDYNDTVFEQYLGMNAVPRIEKIIHCCWLSGEKKPKEYQDCIDSWKVYCPDYEIIEWNTSNYDVEKNKYMKQAYDQKKWAFASDYIRLDVVHEYGGIYLDMDVELVKSLESLHAFRAFFSIDSLGWVDLGSGFGAEAKNKVIRKLLDIYNDIEFNKEALPDGTEGYLPQPSRLLSVFQGMGYVFGTDTQFVNDCMFLSPSYIKVIEDLTHTRRELTGKEYAIHWHNGAWKDYEWREKRQRNSEQLARYKEEYDKKASVRLKSK